MSTPVDAATRDAMLKAAVAAADRAYCPYSSYKVGCALLLGDGRIMSGCNIENAAYPAGICAERTAVAGAIASGCRNFAACLVVTRDGGSPCGICRQTLNEFNPKLPIILAKLDGTVTEETTLDKLLPGAFGPGNLD